MPTVDFNKKLPRILKNIEQSEEIGGRSKEIIWTPPKRRRNRLEYFQLELSDKTPILSPFLEMDYWIYKISGKNPNNEPKLITRDFIGKLFSAFSTFCED